MNQISFGAAQRRAFDDLAVGQRAVQRYGARLDLRHLILSRMRHGGQMADQRAVAGFAELSESLRQSSGDVPSGSWLPLSALTRDLTTGTASAPITGTLSAQAAPGLLPPSAVFNAGATVLSGLSGSTFGIPAMSPTFDSTGLWAVENAPALAREPSFDQAVLSPKTLTVQVVISRRMLLNTSVDLDGLLRAEIVAQLARPIDAAAINGAGSATEPAGLLSNAGLEVLAAGTNGLAPTWAHICDAAYHVEGRAGGDSAAMSWLMPPALAKKMRQTVRVTGGERFILEGGEILGRATRISPAVPSTLTKGSSSGVCSALIFGDWSEVVIGFWGPAAVDILVDDVTLNTQGAVRLVARAEVGIGVRRPGAFVAYKDLLTA
jgi:HK97 family phage major capsid protein